MDIDFFLAVFISELDGLVEVHGCSVWSGVLGSIKPVTVLCLPLSLPTLPCTLPR